jgi:hypothetical protein
MIYVNGDGFAAASYSASNYSWASQDPAYKVKGYSLHPNNHDVSFAKHLNLIFHEDLRNDASEQNNWRKIIRDTLEVIETNDVNYLVITWPNFFKGEITFNDRLISFNFKESDNVDLPIELRNAMHEYFKTFDLKNEQIDFINEVNKLTDRLNERKIKHSFIMGNVLLTNPNLKKDKWMFDPYTQNIKEWARNKFLNNFEYITANGHAELAKLITSHLTNQ